MILDSVNDLPVVLRDVYPAKVPSLKSLNTIIDNASRGPAGKFYRGEHATALVNAFKAEGSCARIVLDEKANDKQKQHFERLILRLKEGDVVSSQSSGILKLQHLTHVLLQFIVVVGGHVLAFCSSENSALAAKLGMSPNLIGLGGNILASEVTIEDDGAYVDAVINADDERW